MRNRLAALLSVPVLLAACSAQAPGQGSTNGQGLIGSWASSAPVLVVAVAACDLCFDASNPGLADVCTTTLPTASEKFHITLTITPGSDAGHVEATRMFTQGADATMLRCRGMNGDTSKEARVSFERLTLT